MNKSRPTYEELEKRLAAAEPIVEALQHHEVDAVVGKEKIAFLLVREVGEALLSSEAEVRAMFELPGVGMVQADTPSFRFTRVNQKFCEITGYSAEELLTKTYISFTHPQDHRRNMKVLMHVLRAKTDSWSTETRCVRKDGSVICVGVSGVALRDETGRAVKLMAMITDITARQQAEEKVVRQVLKDVQKLIDRSIGRPRDKALAEKGKPTRPPKAGVKRARESGSTKSSDKPRLRRR